MVGVDNFKKISFQQAIPMISSLQEDPTVIIAYNNDKLEANVDAKAWIKILPTIIN